MEAPWSVTGDDYFYGEGGDDSVSALGGGADWIDCGSSDFDMLFSTDGSEIDYEYDESCELDGP